MKKIESAPDDKIDNFADDLIERVFGISDAWMSNESLLDDFDSIDSIPGHALIHWSEIPKSDRHLYKKDFAESIDPKKYLVWYPPVSARVWSKVEVITMSVYLGKIESKYRISMEGYPKDEPLYVWKVAAFVKSKLKES